MPDHVVHHGLALIVKQHRATRRGGEGEREGRGHLSTHTHVWQSVCNYTDTEMAGSSTVAHCPTLNPTYYPTLNPTCPTLIFILSSHPPDSLPLSNHHRQPCSAPPPPPPPAPCHPALQPPPYLRAMLCPPPYPPPAPFHPALQPQPYL